MLCGYLIVALAIAWDLAIYIYINGLPTLFGQKVKETLASSLGIIDYDNLTYGDISSTIQNEGMKMCRDLKIQSQANKSKAKYEIGNFCTQYGLPSIISKKRSNIEVKNPLKNPIGRNLPPNIIENRSSKLMISIRKVDLTPQGSSHLKHQEHAISVESKVISKKSVKLRSKPLSIPSLVTKPANKRSLNS